MAKRSRGETGGTSESDALRAQERATETKAAYAGGGKKARGKSGVNPEEHDNSRHTQDPDTGVEAEEYDPDYGEIETTKDESMRIAEEAVELAKDGEREDDGVGEMEDMDAY